MKHIILIITIVILTTGCSLFETKTVTEYKYVNKPVLVCPSPSDLNAGKPIPSAPLLAIYQLTPNSTDGEIARAYEISVEQLRGQVEILRTIVDSYDRTSAEYKKLKSIMEALYPTGSAGTVKFGKEPQQ